MCVYYPHIVCTCVYNAANAYVCLCIAPNVYNLHLIYMCIFTNYRMEWDSNPRYAMHTSVFKTDTFDRSDIHPMYHNAQTHCIIVLQCMYAPDQIRHIYNLVCTICLFVHCTHCIAPNAQHKVCICVYNMFVVWIPLEAIRCLRSCLLFHRACEINAYGIQCTICMWYLRE